MEGSSEGEGAIESGRCGLETGDDVESRGGGATAEMGEEDDTGAAGGCAWEDDGFAGVGAVVVSNGNGRVDSSKTWPLQMRQSATARQRGLTRKIGHARIAQSKEQ